MTVRDWNAQTDPPWCSMDPDPDGYKRAVATDTGDGNTWFAYQSLTDAADVQLLAVMVNSAAADTALAAALAAQVVRDAEIAAALADHDALIAALRAGTKTLPEVQTILADVLQRMGPALPAG